jgi:hypothetical protein
MKGRRHRRHQRQINGTFEICQLQQRIIETQPSSRVAHAVALGATMVAAAVLMSVGSKRRRADAVAGPGRGAPGKEGPKKSISVFVRPRLVGVRS